MTHVYYPGCSSKGTGRPYEESLLAVFQALGTPLPELDDWNCCGATAYPGVDAIKGLALSARNLALAEKSYPGAEAVDVVAACTGCYRALLKAERELAHDGQSAQLVGSALKATGLRHEGRARPRHPLDLLVNDIGLERVTSAVTKPLQGLRVACYYGCLLVRPYATFDDVAEPKSMERLLSAAGAEAIDWPLRTRCCGGSCYCGGPVVGGLPEATLRLSHTLLDDAKRRGADVVATACPLCQFNLEAFQGRMARTFGRPVDLTVAYFTQLVGLALGLDAKALGTRRMLRWRLPERAAAQQPAEDLKQEGLANARA